MKAIPTVYNAASFRSRLEARWAAFFDLAGWRWDYEPLDLEGWAPDFLIHGFDGPILVEVKPAAWRVGPCFPGLDCSAYDKVFSHFERNEGHGLLLGLGPIQQRGEAFIGMCNSVPDSECWTAAAAQGAHAPYMFGYCSADHGWDDRISGYYEGGSWDADAQRVTNYWREAGSLTQWNPSKHQSGLSHEG